MTDDLAYLKRATAAVNNATAILAESNRKAVYLPARCGSLIRETGADDLARHEAKCPACKGGWSIWDLPESEERKLDDPGRGQAEELNAGNVESSSNDPPRT